MSNFVLRLSVFYCAFLSVLDFLVMFSYFLQFLNFLAGIVLLFPVPLLASLVVTLLEMLVSVTVSLLEEEARQISESRLWYTHSMLSDNRKRRHQDNDDLPVQKRTFFVGIGFVLTFA